MPRSNRCLEKKGTELRPPTGVGEKVKRVGAEGRGAPPEGSPKAADGGS